MIAIVYNSNQIVYWDVVIYVGHTVVHIVMYFLHTHTHTFIRTCWTYCCMSVPVYVLVEHLLVIGLSIVYSLTFGVKTNTQEIIRFLQYMLIVWLSNVYIL